MRATMQNTLRQNYGVDSQHEFNRAVTEGWDRVQEKVRTFYLFFVLSIFLCIKCHVIKPTRGTSNGVQ